MNDTPVLKTPGEMIAEARETRGLTIAQLSDRTKIPPKVLAALEMDEYHKISGPLYIKSFLRTCAMDLGLDPDEVLSLYNKISGEKEIGTPGAETVWGEEEVKVSRIGLPWLRITAVVGVAAILIGVGLFGLRGGGDDSSSEPETVADQVQTLTPAESLAAGVVTDSSDAPHRGQSMMTAETEAGLRALAADTVPHDPVPEQVVDQVAEQAPEEVPEPAPASVLPDTFFTALAARAETVRDSLQRVAAAESLAAAQDLPVDETAQSETAPAREEEPPAATPVQDTVVIESERDQGGGPASSPEPFMESSWPLVLSITCDRPQNIRVKRDGDREFSQVRWPASGQEAPPVPQAGFVAGLAYSYYDNLVVFWGAEDHFSIILERVRGVQVAINGSPHDISRLNPGQELILDAYVAGAGAGN